MKSAKEFIQERLDELALEKHDMFYDDLPQRIKETLWVIADREWVDSYSDYLDHIFEQAKDKEMIKC